MHRFLKLSRTALGIAASLAIVACDRSDSPTAASSTGGTAPQNAPMLLQSPPSDRAAAKNDSTATKRIGTGGGTVHLSNIIMVRFPEGSLQAETDITIRLIDRERVLFSITPADLALARSVDITIDHLDQTDDQRFTGLAIYRQEGDSWTQLPSGRNKNKLQGTSGALGIFAVAQASDQLAKGESLTSGLADIEMLRWLSGPSHETKLIAASQGGEVATGRFKVKIPKNALAQDTYITVRDPGTGYLMCELEPHGIQFLAPVELEMNIDGLEVGDYTDWTIFWFNEATGGWEDQGANYSLSAHKLSADLMHFSRYAGGRAGW